MLALWVLFLVWVKTTDWINKDTQLLNLQSSLWNPVNFFPFFVAFFLLALTLPNFVIGYGALPSAGSCRLASTSCNATPVWRLTKRF